MSPDALTTESGFVIFVTEGFGKNTGAFRKKDMKKQWLGNRLFL